MTNDLPAAAFNVVPLLRKSAAERVITQIIGLIRSGNVTSGDRLPTEADLANAFQVSRPIVREALRALAILGIVETRQGGRCFVTDLSVARLMAPLQFVISLDETSVDALHEARLMTEVGIIRRAALHSDERVLARLDEMVAAGFLLVKDPVGFRMLDQEFHRTINQLGGNPFLNVVAQSFYELGMEYRRMASESRRVLERSAAEHSAIAEALKRSDPDEAAAAMSVHLNSIHESTLQEIRRATRLRRKGI